MNNCGCCISLFIFLPIIILFCIGNPSAAGDIFIIIVLLIIIASVVFGKFTYHNKK